MRVKVYFLRHGQAAGREEWHGDDAERPLTEDGKARMMREGKALAKLGLEVDTILTSPLARAKQTAEIVADAVDMHGKVREDERLGPGFDPAKLAGILRDCERDGAIMLVGHEPDFSETIGAIIGGGKVDLKKGGLAYVDVPQASSVSGELVWLLPPKLLAL